MLDELRRLRALQLQQRQALIDADGERFTAVHEQRMALQSGLQRPGDGTGAEDRDEAAALLSIIESDQDALIELAIATRDRLRGELREISSGRAAVHGYRPPQESTARYLDSAR